MTRWRYAERAALLLRRAEVRRVPNVAARQRGIATIERALTARAQRRSGRAIRASGAVAAAAAAAMLWLWLGRTSVRPSLPADPAVAVTVIVSPLGAGATLLEAAGASAVDSGHALEAGSRIVTEPEGAAELRLSTGTRLELGAASVLALERRDRFQQFSLSRGQLEASVAKLAPQERFVVGTPDAEVEVRGTEFRLRVIDTPLDCGRGSRTRLEVQEGVVEVRRGSEIDRVGAGEHWPRDCGPQEEGTRKATESPPAPVIRDTSSARSPAAPRAANPVQRSMGSAPGGVNPAPGGAPSSAHSTLAEQNALFAEALRAKQRGDGDAALALYTEFLLEYPESPLAENAVVQRMRLLVERDRGLAKAEAERYLKRYPRGFAEREARELAERR